MKRTGVAMMMWLLCVLAFAQGKAPQKIDVSGEKVGAEPSAFIPMVGIWSIADDGGKKVVLVDGRMWERGTPAGALAEKARSIYGAKHEEFIDNVKAFAYFPYAVARDVDDFQNGEISMNFKMLGGQLDSCSGILFNVKPNGDYLTVRFNGKEDNLVLWKFVNGKRSFVKRGSEEVPLQRNQWYSMKVVTKGKKIEGYLNGKLLIEYEWTEPISGKIGLWSKTDSISEFSDYVVNKQ